MATLWKSANGIDVYVNTPDPHINDWILSLDGKYAIDLEDENVQSKIQNNISMLMRGCKCRAMCGNRCGCRRKSSYCGQGCECRGCLNLPIDKSSIATDSDSSSTVSDCEESNDDDDATDDSDELEAELVTDIDNFD